MIAVLVLGGGCVLFGEKSLDFASYTMEARGAIAGALESAQAQGAPAIGPEHLTLGLLNPDVHASLYLSSLVLAKDDLRTSLSQTLGRSQAVRDKNAGDDGLPMTPEAKAVLRAAYRGAQDAGREKVSSGDILLALIESETVATQTLKAIGISADKVREALRADQERGTLPVK